MEHDLRDSLTEEIEIEEVFNMIAEIGELHKRCKSIQKDLCDLYQDFNSFVDKLKENYDEDLLSHCNFRKIDANLQGITEDSAELNSDIKDIVKQLQ